MNIKEGLRFARAAVLGSTLLVASTGETAKAQTGVITPPESGQTDQLCTEEGHTEIMGGVNNNGINFVRELSDTVGDAVEAESLAQNLGPDTPVDVVVDMRAFNRRIADCNFQDFISALRFVSLLEESPGRAALLQNMESYRSYFEEKERQSGLTNQTTQ